MDFYGDRNIKGNSKNWKNWMCAFIPTTCIECMEKHGKIYPIKEKVELLHEHCYCDVVPMRTKSAGTVTDKRKSGTDIFLMWVGQLPGEYITKKEAKKFGWKPKKGNLNEVLPGRVIGGDVYYNKDGKLPQKNERIWYEADFDYYSGYRNNCRILYSSDGLMFASYDHCITFYEIIKEDHHGGE